MFERSLFALLKVPLTFAFSNVYVYFFPLAIKIDSSYFNDLVFVNSNGEMIRITLIIKNL